MPSQINEMAFLIPIQRRRNGRDKTNSPSQVLSEGQSQSAGPAVFPF